MRPISYDETFSFSCSKDVPCFTLCCQDLNQFLTPYDVLRLKNGLGLGSDIFLERYTSMHIGPETGLPVVEFKRASETDLKCPFVTPEGCGVYEDRPSSCRMYPVARLASRSRETGEVRERFFLVKESHCLGFQQVRAITARQWTRDQGLEIYNLMNDLLMEIISLKNMNPRPMDKRSLELFYLACYNLDVFRSRITEYMDPDEAKKDDTALLKTTLEWTGRKIFGNH